MRRDAAVSLALVGLLPARDAVRASKHLGYKARTCKRQEAQLSLGYSTVGAYRLSVTFKVIQGR